MKKAIRTEQDRQAFIRLLSARELPCTVSIAKGAPRSIEQNKTQRLWVNEIAEQCPDDDAEGWRAYIKLRIGVPILRAENDDFAEQYDRVVKPLPYEQKLDIMREPIDLPVTRLMTTSQHARLLDEIWVHFGSMGVQLTDPNSQGRELYRRTA